MFDCLSVSVMSCNKYEIDEDPCDAKCFNGCMVISITIKYLKLTNHSSIQFSTKLADDINI